MATAAQVEEIALPKIVPRAVLNRFYAPELDGLRFLAFILVFLRHVATALGMARMRIHSDVPGPTTLASLSGPEPPLNSSWSMLQGGLQSLDFGVSLFFFLSAFLITRLLLVERQAAGTISVRDFYVRRSLRIWPLYFSFLVLILVMSQFLPVLHVSPARLWVAIFFVANWAAVLHGWQGMAIQPLWSVSVEEQFYLVWPNLARFGRAAIIGASIVFGIVALSTLAYYGQRPGTTVSQVWPNTMVQCMFLSAGALTACLSTPETRRLSLRVRVALLSSGFVAWFVAGAAFHVVRTESPGTVDLIAGYLLILAGTYLIFTAVAGWNSRPLPRWLLYLGKISYGLYVFHVACLLVSEVAVSALASRFHPAHASPYLPEMISSTAGLLLTVGCASLSYAFLEKPFLRLKKHFTVVASRPL